MKRVLFYCNTYFQLITAIRIKQTIKISDEAYLILTDHSSGSKQVLDKLERSNVFTKVWYFETKKIIKHRNILDTIKNVFSGVFGFNLLNIDKNIVFDEFVGYNFDIPSHMVYAYCLKKNKKMVCNRLEEGIFSYFVKPDSCRELTTICRIRKILAKKNLRNEAISFYCFNPELYDGKLTPVSVPKIKSDDKDIKELLRDVFDVKVSEFDSFNYVYLPCIYDMEGGAPIGELELAKRLADVVGKENLIVKVHPRDDKNKYIDLGMNVCGASSVPIEVLLLTCEYSNKIFMTSLSSSLLTMSTLLEEKSRCYYLFPLCDLSKNYDAQYYSKILLDLLSKGKEQFKNIRIAEELKLVM